MDKKVDKTGFNDIYEDIAECLGVEVAVKIYERYRGQQITFPVKLYSIDFVVEQIVKNEKQDIKKIAREYNFTEQWLRRMLQKKERKNNKDKMEEI